MAKIKFNQPDFILEDICEVDGQVFFLAKDAVLISNRIYIPFYVAVFQNLSEIPKQENSDQKEIYIGISKGKDQYIISYEVDSRIADFVFEKKPGKFSAFFSNSSFCLVYNNLHIERSIETETLSDEEVESAFNRAIEAKEVKKIKFFLEEIKKRKGKGT